MVKLPGVIAKDAMSAMVKLAEMFQESSLDFICYGIVSTLSDDFREKVLCRAQCSLLLCPAECRMQFVMSLSRRKAALQAETNASLANQAAVSKKQAALRETTAAEEQQKIADEALEHQAEIETETRVEEGTATELKSQAEPVKKSLVVQQHLGTRLQ